MNPWGCLLGQWLLLAVPPSAPIDAPSAPIQPAVIAAGQAETATRHEAHSADPADDDLSHAELRELEQIRRRVGSNPLRGSLLDDVQLPGFSNSPHEDFAKQLRADYGADSPTPSGLPDRSARSQPTGKASHASKLTPELTPEAAEYEQRSLRSLRRRLEAIALDLEELNRFPEAQRIRELKQSLN